MSLLLLDRELALLRACVCVCLCVCVCAYVCAHVV